MSGITWAKAVYDPSRWPGVVTIMDGETKHVCRVTANGEHPGAGALSPAGYFTAPGSRWTEKEEGVWQVTVYRHEDS